MNDQDDVRQWECPQCHERHDLQFDACWNCGFVSSDPASHKALPAPAITDASSEKPILSLRPRFSLRTLLTLVTVLCVAGGLWLRQFHRQARICEKLAKSGAHIQFAANDHSLRSFVFPSRDIRGIDLPRDATDEHLGWVADLSCVDELTLHGSSAITARGWNQLRRCQNLKQLSAFRVNVTPEAAKAMSELRQLELMSFSHSHFAPPAVARLSRAPSLLRITFWENNQFEAGNRFEEGGLSSLAFVNANATPELLASVVTLKSLVQFIGRGPEFTDKELAFIAQKALTSLHLEYTSITDEGLATLARMKSLEALSLVGMDLSASGLAHLESLPNLTSLHLSDTTIGDQGFETIGRLSKLKVVYLTETNVTAAGARSLKSRLPKADIHWRN